MDISRVLPGMRGKTAERHACRFLENHGLKLVDHNYRCRHGEIDLIMRDGRSLVFVEVRYRGDGRFACSAETVDRRKRSRLASTALHYLQSHPAVADFPARFDVVTIDVKFGKDRLEWIRNAFDVETLMS